MAICPCCQSEFERAGELCAKGGLYSVEEDAYRPDDRVLGHNIDGKYIALRRVGRGGMGAVYEARQVALDRRVALKVLSRTLKNHGQAFERFLREAESIGRISHHHIVKLFDFGVEPDGLAYLAMEFVDGRVLSRLEPQELSGQLIAHICAQTLSALEAAHSVNIIHRDLKPDNIMLTTTSSDGYYVKVLDFGLASLIDGSRISAVGEALGTPWYMSPEQATASPVTFSSDIYSLGCILYELVSAKPPFPGNRPYNVMMQHVNTQPPPLVCRPELEISPELRSFIMRCLEKNPQMRYGSASAARAELKTMPEWLTAALSQPSQSIRIGMKQLILASEVKEELSSGLLPSVETGTQFSGGEQRRAKPSALKPYPLYLRMLYFFTKVWTWVFIAVVLVLGVVLYWWLR